MKVIADWQLPNGEWPETKVRPLWREAIELTSIMASSRKTAKLNTVAKLTTRQLAIGNDSI